jgi:hypothetical protein
MLEIANSVTAKRFCSMDYAAAPLRIIGIDRHTFSDRTERQSMGYDYSSIHVFAGNLDPNTIRSRVAKRICDVIPGRVSTDAEATRSVVVGPPDRWIFVGDTTSGTDDGDPAAFDSLVCELSTVAPTLSILMSDSACVHLYLRHHREPIDKFGTGKFPFFPFDSENEADSFRGVVQRWSSLTLETDGPNQLRSVWDTKNNADNIVKSTAGILGIYPALAGCGFTIFNESEEIYYRDWLDGDPILFKRFDEYYFA